MADLVVYGTVGASRWPPLVNRTEAMKARPGFAENLATCRKMLGRLVPERLDLS